MFGIEGVRWSVLWHQMSTEEQYMCGVLSLLIAISFVKKVTRFLKQVRSKAETTGGSATTEADRAANQTKRHAATWIKDGKPPGGKRLSVACAAAVCWVVLLPLGWKTTEVYRATLPDDAMKAEGGLPPAMLPLRLHVHVITSASTDLNQERLQESARAILQGADDHPGPPPPVVVTAGITIPSHCTLEQGEEWGGICGLGGKDWAEAKDEDVDEWLHSVAPPSAAHCGNYTLVLIEGAGGGGGGGGPLVLGKYRHAWVRSEGAVTAAAAAEALERRARDLLLYLRHGGVPKDPLRAALPVSAYGRLQLSFTLLNAAPTASHHYSWDFREMKARFLDPMLEGLAGVADVTVDSQVLHHAAGRIAPEWDEAAQAHLLPHAALPFFIDSDWHLDAPTAPAHVSILNFLVYIPPEEQCPMHLGGSAGGRAATDAFTVPGWGGLMLWNPPTPRTRKITGAELAPLMGLMAAQLRSQLGLPPGPPSQQAAGAVTVKSVPASRTGFAQWETDELMRRHVMVGQHRAGAALSSLAETLESLPNMVVEEHIQEEVTRSLEHLAAARAAVRASDYPRAASAAAGAHAAAEAAFFHPSILSLLYFPGEHKLAVYLPLLLPILSAVIIRTATELYHFGRRTIAVKRFRRKTD